MKYLILLLAVASTSCTDPVGTTKFLQKEHYTNIQIQGIGGPFDCWDDDDTVTKFTAEKNGVRYVGSVCCGLFMCEWGKKPTAIKP